MKTKRPRRTVPVNAHTAIVMEGARPVAVLNDGSGRDPIGDAEQHLGHPLEFAEFEAEPEGAPYRWRARAWFHEGCTCPECE